MSNTIEVTLPDVGDFDQVEIIEILVAVGDQVEAEDSLLTLESDKASMEIPSPHGGRVTRINVAVGEKISKGDPVWKSLAAISPDRGIPLSVPALA